VRVPHSHSSAGRQQLGIPRVRLAAFITANTEPILVEWESFARSIWPPGASAEPQELRDSAEQILHAIVTDMAAPQTGREQSEKSEGRGAHSTHSDRLDHASQVHGAGRVGSGLGLPALIAEYRALRASVLRLWRASLPEPDLHDLDDITRFNEAIDQSLALAVFSFTRRIDTARNMFLGILGHDLRNPLSAITLTAKVANAALPRVDDLPEQLAQIVQSAQAISTLITDLIDFTTSAMGRLAPARADLHLLCEEVLREMQAAHPGRSARLSVKGDLDGTWDPHRLRQLISNLVANAFQHGAPETPVQITADGSDPDTVVITVHNQGDPIPAEVLPTIFDPLTRGPAAIQDRRTPGSIGLGLYIVREIATAHGGTADLTSTPTTGTTATIHLPRHAKK
jgi:signal transduction histidine kinase